MQPREFVLPCLSSVIVWRAIRDRGLLSRILRALRLRRRLSPAEEVRLAALTALANDVLAAEGEFAQTWWQTPRPWLDGRSSVDQLVRRNGIAVVAEMRDRMNYGIYS